MIPGRLDGIGWFSWESLQRMVRQHPEVEFIFITDRPAKEELRFGPNVELLSCGPKTRHPLLWYHWFEHRIPGVLKNCKADLFLSPDGFLSLRTPVPSLPVIHDINFFHRPQDLPPSVARYYNKYFPRFAAKAVRIATVSQFSAHDIAENYGIDPAKIDVVYNGASEIYRPLSWAEQENVRREYSQRLPYFLFVGNLHPRKNTEGLLKAWELFRRRYPKPFRLIIVGRKLHPYPALEKALAELENKDEVLFLSNLPQTRLHRLYASACGLIFLPWFEGFGIPLIEAMACHTPAVASNTTSLPEVLGNAGLIVDPADPEEAARAMLRLCREENLREHLIQESRIQIQKYSWDRTATLLWESVQACINTP